MAVERAATVSAGHEDNGVIEVKLPTYDDVRLICAMARPDEQEQYTALCGAPWDAERVTEEVMARTGPKWAAHYNGTVFVVGGYDHVINDVWQAWMVGTMAYWDQYWRSITKVSRKAIQAMLDSGARRIQVGALASREKTCEWYVKGLKMTFEGYLQGFGANGETMAMYAKVRE